MNPGKATDNEKPSNSGHACNGTGARLVSSSLLRNTAATAAKSKKTCLDAGQKSSSLNRPTPLTSGNNSIVRTALSKKATPVATASKMVSERRESAKKVQKVATSSFISGETKGGTAPDHQDWDASVIAPPTILQMTTSSVSSNENTSIQSRGNCSTLASAISDHQPSRHKQAFKSRLGPGKKVSKPVKERFARGPLKVMHPSNTSRHNRSELLAAGRDDVSISTYDDYLISELAKLNAKQRQEKVCGDVRRDIVSLWSALEAKRSEVLKKQKHLATLNEHFELIKLFRTVGEPIKYVQSRVSEVRKSVNELADGLCRSRGNMEVLGLNLDGENSDDLCRILEDNSTTASEALDALDGGYVGLERMKGDAACMKVGLADIWTSFKQSMAVVEDIKWKNNKEASLLGSCELGEEESDFSIKCVMNEEPLGTVRGEPS